MADAKTPTTQPDLVPSKGGGFLDRIERLGNRLPDPTTLFLVGTLFVMLLSHIAFVAGWEVQPKLPSEVQVEGAAPGQTATVWKETDDPPLRAKSLLTREGLFWAITSMVTNFMEFPPLGVVLVGMLGIGIAERTGLLGAVLKSVMLVVPNSLLTPTMIFVGIMSSMTLDAGYVVLPPLAAALYKSVGRSPLAGLAAVFAGVAAGFNANLLITALDPMLAGFSSEGARVVEETYTVSPAANWYFMIASTGLMTLVGWGVTSFLVERRLRTKAPEDGGPTTPSEDELAEQRLKPEEKRGLAISGVVFALVLGAFMAMILIPGAPLHTSKMRDQAELARAQENYAALVASGVSQAEAEQRTIARVPKIIGEPWHPPKDQPDAAAPEGSEVVNGVVLVPSDEHFDRWVEAIVPMLFICFLIPAIAYGVTMGVLRSDKDVAKLLMESMSAMAPIIVLAFIAAQFIKYFSYCGLDKMLALWGGQTLGQADMPIWLLLVAFILMTMVFNLFVGSMSAKYALFAPIFVPMFMYVGISPELTQAAYRIGDSTSNIITPLNPYLIIILVFMQKYVPKGGMGTLISTMLPYTVVFTVVWMLFMVLWTQMGWPLGPDGPLHYTLPAATGLIGIG